jgi:hypothetical protein
MKTKVNVLVSVLLIADVIVQQFGISLDPKIAPDNNKRRTESLYVEGVKK